MTESPPTGPAQETGRPAVRRKGATPSKTGWLPGPRKQSAFVFLFRPSGEIYAVCNRRGELGAPGGKRDPEDSSIWATARREFAEETGGVVPTGIYPHFEWGDPHHSVRIYYREVSEDAAAALPTGAAPDPEGDEVEVLWADCREGPARERFRPHLRVALRALGGLGVLAR